MDLNLPWAYAILQALFVAAAIFIALTAGYVSYLLLEHTWKLRRSRPRPGLCKCKHMFLQADEDHIIGEDDNGKEDGVWHARWLCQPLRETILQDD